MELIGLIGRLRPETTVGFCLEVIFGYQKLNHPNSEKLKTLNTMGILAKTVQ